MYAGDTVLLSPQKSIEGIDMNIFRAFNIAVDCCHHKRLVFLEKN